MTLATQKIMLLLSLVVGWAAAATEEDKKQGRNIFIDLGANWANTLRLYEDLPLRLGGTSDAPWEVFAFEASPLIAPYVDTFVQWLNGERPAKPELCLPASGSSNHLAKYAQAYGCRGRNHHETNHCMFQKLDSILKRLAPDPRLRELELVEARLARARAPAPPRGASTRYTFVPAAAGVAAGEIEFYNDPHQLIRGGSEAPSVTGNSIKFLNRENFVPLAKGSMLKCNVVDVPSWIRDSFRAEDHVVLKMDIEGFEYPIFDKLIDNGGLGLVDVLFLEAHNKGFSGSRFHGANHLRAELQRRAPGIHVFEENRGSLRGGFKFEGIDSKSVPAPPGELHELQRRCAEAKEVWVDSEA